MSVQKNVRLSGVIFDLDGTLSNTWPPAIDAFRAAIANHAKRQFSDEELMALAGPSEDGILQKLFPDSWEDCFEKYLTGFSERLEPGKILYPGVYAGLERLKAGGCRLAIVSGKTKPAVDECCRQTNMTGLFDLILGGSAEGDRKVECISDVLGTWSADPRDVVYIGDTSGDIRSALATNTIPIGAAWAETANRNKLAEDGAHFVFDEPRDFFDWAEKAMRPSS